MRTFLFGMLLLCAVPLLAVDNSWCRHDWASRYERRAEQRERRMERLERVREARQMRQQFAQQQRELRRAQRDYWREHARMHRHWVY